jgi:hypothetical protein
MVRIHRVRRNRRGRPWGKGAVAVMAVLKRVPGGFGTGRGLAQDPPI